MDSHIVQQARAYMQQCTIQNQAPARELTEIAIHYGSILAKSYDINENKVLTALYLAHCIFSNQRGSDTMKNHTTLSAQQARIWLEENNTSRDDIEDICTAIQLHHTTQDSGNMFYEVVKNAECFKFLTRQGILIFMHHLGQRGLDYTQAKEYTLHKIQQKQSYLTLPKAKELAQDFIDKYEDSL